MGQRLQGQGIREFNDAAAAVDQFLRSQSLHDTIEMRDAQSKDVRHDFLRKRKFETALFSPADIKQPGVNFEQKMTQALDRSTSSDIDDVFGIDGRFLHAETTK